LPPATSSTTPPLRPARVRIGVLAILTWVLGLKRGGSPSRTRTCDHSINSWDAQITGFGVRVNDGSPPDISFVLVTRYPGATQPAPRKIADYRVGAKEEDRKESLAKARQIAREWRELIAKGIDPKVKAQDVRRDAERLRREAERQQANTFAAAFDAFAQEHLAQLRTGDVVQGVIKKHVIPIFGARPLSEITRAEGNDLLRALVKKIPTGANRVRSYLKTFGAWAEDDGRIDESPFANLKRLTKEKARDRVLSDLEIRAIWRACGEMGAFGRAFRFMLVVGQRRSEVGDMEWREIDEAAKRWVLPRERTKSDRIHEQPLSPLALSILAEAPKIGPHVFATRAPRRSAEGVKRAATAPLSGWSKAKTRLDALALAELKRIAGDDAALPEWHLHDFRRSCATNLARLGVDRLVISKLLNHAEGDVTQVYDRYAYEPEKRAALNLWGARLVAIVEGGEGGNVIHLAARG
jgi:integrase